MDCRYNLWMRLKVNMMQHTHTHTHTHESGAKYIYNACLRSPIGVVEMIENKTVKISSMVFIYNKYHSNKM